MKKILLFALSFFLIVSTSANFYLYKKFKKKNKENKASTSSFVNFNDLEKTFYGKDKDSPHTFVFNNNESSFTPSDVKDHFATKFFENPLYGKNETYRCLMLLNFGKNNDATNLKVLLQDQKCDVFESVTISSAYQEAEDCFLLSFLEIPSSVKKFRLCFQSIQMKKTKLPVSLAIMEFKSSLNPKTVINISQDSSFLKEKLLRSIPGLQASINENNQLEAVRSIRKWCAENINFCNDADNKELHDGATLKEVLSLIEEKKAGFVCGGFSEVSAMIYELFGFPAVALDTGLPTHVINVVEIVHNGKKIFVGEDSFMNSEYGLKGQDVADFRDVMRNIAEKRVGDVIHLDWHPDSKFYYVKYKRDFAFREIADKPDSEYTKYIMEIIPAIQYDATGKIIYKEGIYRRYDWLKDFSHPYLTEHRKQLAKKLGLQPSEIQHFHAFLLLKGINYEAKSDDFKRCIEEYKQICNDYLKKVNTK